MKSLVPAVLVLAACGGAAAQPQPADPAPTKDPREARWHAEAEELLSYLRITVDRACACDVADCARGVDDELRAYNQAGIDKPDEFSKDEDERFGASMGFRAQLEPLQLRYLECLANHEVPPFSFGPFLLHDVRKSRDAACACTDYACARQVEEDMKEWPNLPADPETTEQVMAIAKETGECLRAIYQEQGSPEAQQMLLDLKDIREQTCACPDEACVLAASEALKALAQEYQDTRPDKTQEPKMMELLEEIKACAAERRASFGVP